MWRWNAVLIGVCVSALRVSVGGLVEYRWIALVCALVRVVSLGGLV